MRIYRLPEAIVLEHAHQLYVLAGQDWDALINRQGLHDFLVKKLASLAPVPDLSREELVHALPPVGRQEVWASGVTYFRSRVARMEEAEAAGGGDFYDKVYEAERPELFFKAPPYRVVGPHQQVRIRSDSSWDVPEPELTLFISPAGTIEAYTIGNDMSSRSIEGENPLYLPQAKTYNGSAALGPCLYVPGSPLPPATSIHLHILRDGQSVFSESITIDQMKRRPEELVAYLYREMDFPHGCFLMTGTGIVPPASFTLQHGDEIRIRIDAIGELVNTVA
ncbi:MAG: 2-hydroxyhepta-2,4-diene-1,7-dioate isomerase [Bacteroidetes bacterium]|nr:MAG: 2-hydroxyhepta-2,4-diene-1,7-dioate isomerase [Bacteroidota bacterium]